MPVRPWTEADRLLDSANRGLGRGSQTLQLRRRPDVIGIATPDRLGDRSSSFRRTDVLLHLHPRPALRFVVPEVEIRSPPDRVHIHTTTDLHGGSQCVIVI